MTTVESIKVVIRFRPNNTREKEWSIKNKIDVNNFVVSIAEPGCQCVEIFTRDGLVPKKKFFFDYIFNHETPQDKFFNIAAKGVVENLFLGFNATIFAYGQTGSGKTWSMMGPSYGARLKSPELRGVIPRSIDYIFDRILNSPPNLEYKLSVSYLEIYKEKIKDLLFPKNDNLPIHGTPRTGIFIKGLSEIFVGNRDEILRCITKGDYNRSMAKTDMNAHSSRSHSVFILKIETKNAAEGSTTVAKLNLVDLAGSEKVGKTNVTGTQLEEAKKINQSLSALGHCINSIVKKKKHVPFRDSKLTRILEESIGGHSKCSIICAASRHFFNKDETISTLGFGKRAKSIQVRVKQNKVLSAEQLMKIVARLKKRLYIARQKNKALLLTIKELRELTEAEKKELESLKKVKVDKNLIGKTEEEVVNEQEGGGDGGGGDGLGDEESEGEALDDDFSNVEDDSAGMSELVSPASSFSSSDMDSGIVNLTLEALQSELKRIKIEQENEKQFYEETLDNEKQSVKILNVKVEEMEKKMKIINEENTELLNEKEKIDHIKSDMNDKFQFEKEMSESRISQYENENADLLKKVGELEEINQDLCGKVEMMEGSNIKDPNKRGEFQSQLEKYRREFKEVKTENDYLMGMVEKKNEKVDELHAQVMQREQKAKSEELKYEKLNKFKDSLITQLEEFEGDLKTAESNVETLAVENKKFEMEGVRVKGENEVLFQTMQEKDLLLKKLRILCEKNNVDVLEIREIKMEDLMEDYKKRTRENLEEGSEGSLSEEDIALRLLDEDHQFSTLQQFETAELKQIETLAYGPDVQQIAEIPGYIQLQDGTFQRTTDGEVVVAESMIQGEDGHVQGPDGLTVVGFQNEDGSVIGVGGEAQSVAMAIGYIQTVDGNYQSTTTGAIVQNGDMVKGEGGIVVGPDGTMVIGMQALAGNVVFTQEGGKGPGGMEQFDSSQPGYVQKQDQTFVSVKDGKMLQMNQMVEQEGGLYTGPDGGYVIGMEAPGGGIVNLMDPQSTMMPQQVGMGGVMIGMGGGGEAMMGAVQEQGYIQLADGNFQSTVDGGIYTGEQMTQGQDGITAGPDGGRIIGIQKEDGSVVSVQGGGSSQFMGTMGQQEGYIQLQDGNFQSTYTGTVVVGEQITKDGEGVFRGPDGSSVVGMQTLTGEVVSLDQSGGMEQFEGVNTGYIQLQDGNFQSLKGDVVQLEVMSQGSTGIVGPDGGSVLGMQTPYGTIVNLQEPQVHAVIGGVQGGTASTQQGGTVMKTVGGSEAVVGGEEEKNAPPPKLPTIKVSEIMEKKKKKRFKPNFSLPSPSQLKKDMVGKKDGHPKPPPAPMMVSIKADEFQEQLLTEVEKNRELEKENRKMKNELRELKFELEDKDTNLIEKEVKLRTETVHKGLELSKLRVKEMEERLKEKEEQNSKYRKKKEETITVLEDEKKNLIAEREKYIQEATKGGGGGRGRGGGFKNLADEFFGLRLKNKKMEDDLKFYRKNYGMQRKQNASDRRKMKDQEEQIIRSTKRIGDVEKQLDIARNRYTQRKEVVEEFTKERKRLQGKIEQLKEKIEFMKEIQDTKKEIETTTSIASGSLQSGKVVKVLRGGSGTGGRSPLNSMLGGGSIRGSIRGGGGSGGRSPLTTSIRGGGGTVIRGGGKTIRGGGTVIRGGGGKTVRGGGKTSTTRPSRPSRPARRGRGRKGRGRF